VPGEIVHLEQLLPSADNGVQLQALVVAFLALQQYWQDGLAAGSLK
jgi:hypothetical protein